MTDRIIPLPEALQRLGGISRTSFYRGVERGEFPPLVKITPRRGGVLESQLTRIIADAADRTAATGGKK